MSRVWTEDELWESIVTARNERDQFRDKLAKLCNEIAHIGHLRSCSYNLTNGPDGDYCSCNLHLRKELIKEARAALDKK